MTAPRPERKYVYSVANHAEFMDKLVGYQRMREITAVRRSRKGTGRDAVQQPVHQTSVDGLTVAFHRAGTGPTLLLLHGFIADSTVWSRQMESLSTDFEVIAWDAPGCGGSSDPGEYFSMTEYADCLAGLLGNIGITSAHICGLSWGGTLALEFYRRHPSRVRSLILADTYAGWTGSLGAEAAALRLERCLRESELIPEEWVPQWVPDAFSSAAPSSLLDDLSSIMWEFHPVGFRAMSRAVAPDFREVLHMIEVPTLLLWGAEDSRSPPGVGDALRDGIPGSHLVTIPGAGHVSNMEQPQAFNEAVRLFAQGIDRDKAK